MRARYASVALVVVVVGSMLAAAATSATATADPSTVSLALTCVAHAPIIGDQQADQMFSITTDAPLAVQPGATFSVTAQTPVDRIASNQGSGTVSSIKDIAIKIPVPANSTFVSASLSGGTNIGSGTPTATLSGSATTGTVTVSVPGPIPADQDYQLPAVTITLTAGTTTGATIQPRMGGTSTSDPGFTTTAVVTSPISADVPTDCYPTPPNPAWSTTTIVPVDTTPPTIVVSTPSDGGQYPLGGTVAANYQCNDGTFGSGVATCAGDVANGAPIDTSSLGSHTFTVTASDNNGNVATPVTTTYTVVPPGNDHTPPVITLTSPADGAVYLQNAAASASYSCSDDGSGIASCTGDVANGGAVATSVLGAHTFTVSATDGEGNAHTVVHSYRVTPPPVQQDWTTGDVTDRMPVACDTLLNSFHESIPVASNTAPTSVGAGQQFAWSLAVGQDQIPTLNNATNLVYRWKKPTNGHFVSVAFTGAGSEVNGTAIGINPDGTLQMTVASVTDQSILGFGADNFTPPPFRAVVQADGAAAATVQNEFDYFQITTTTIGLVTTTQHCPAGDTYNGRTNVPITTTTIVDDTPPAITVSSPVHGATYAVGAALAFTYSCTDDSSTPSCIGDVASGGSLDTTTSGPHRVHVTSVDAAGNTSVTWISYTVADPTVSVADASVLEGPGATLDFVVTMSNPSSRVVTVDYSTADGTATQPTDYTATSGTLTFNPGDPLTQTVSVPVMNNTIYTGNRALTFGLVSAVHATIAGAGATGSIIDDDPPPVSVADAAVTEGPGANLDFAVSLAAQPNLPVTVDYQTGDGTATAPGRYAATSGTLVFNPGDPLVQHVLVPVVDDAIYNEGASPNNTQTMTLTAIEPANGYSGTGTGTITDNDPQPSLISIGSTTLREGDAYNRVVSLGVTLNKPSTQTITVTFSTAPGSATALSDYKTKSGTLTFKPGVISKTIGVTTIGDTLAEPDETFSVKLGTATNAIVANGTGTVTILNDDSPTATGLEATVSDASVYEGTGAGKVVALPFQVSLNRRPTASVTVHYSLVPDTASVGSDFKTKSGTITFSTLQVAKTVTVWVIADSLHENDETFHLVLDTPSAGLTITKASGTGTILNDD